MKRAILRLLGALLLTTIVWGAAQLHGGLYEVRAVQSGSSGVTHVWHLNRLTGALRFCQAYREVTCEWALLGNP